MHDGAKALAAVEANGIRVDVDYLDKTIGKVQRRIDSLTKKLKEGEEWKVWQRVYRAKANLGSRPQLGRVLFREMGYEEIAHLKKEQVHLMNQSIQIDHTVEKLAEMLKK